MLEEQTLEELKQTIESLSTSLSQTESELAAAKKQYKERKTSHLRELYEARNETDAAIREELRALNMTAPASAYSALRISPFRF
jgi:SMC interacting uncharacterized protein involved in chromosome segregation|tara:strand:+ start:422 stop:673 length:252 start_codon:yes stop_codon:yes gene_type:complete